MSVDAGESLNTLIEKLRNLFLEKFSVEVTENLIILTKEFFSVVSEEELLFRDIMDLYGMILSYWRFMQQKQNESHHVRVYNPSIDRHGWTSRHTVIELNCSDKPFLIDSLLMVLNKLNVSVHFMMYVGGLCIQRDTQNNVVEIMLQKVQESQVNHHPNDPVQQKHLSQRRESLVTLEIDRQKDDSESLDDICNRLLQMCEQITLIVNDFEAMKFKLAEAKSEIKNYPKSLEQEETLAFLNWIENSNYIFLGYTELKLLEKDSQKVYQSKPSSCLGLLSLGKQFLSTNHHLYTVQTGRRKVYVKITKSDQLSPVHRDAYMDIIAISIYDAQVLVGEHRFIGLYTYSTYRISPFDIPFMRQKVQKILDRSKFQSLGYSYRALSNILETYPRDELFLSTENELFNNAMGIMHIKERQITKLFIRHDQGGYYFCMLYMPRDRFNSSLRNKIEHILKESLGGKRTTFKTHFLDSILCRIDFEIFVDPASSSKISELPKIEQKICEASREWLDEFLDYLIESHGENVGRAFFQDYKEGFSPAYKDYYLPRSAVHDVALFEKCRATDQACMSLYRLLEESSDRVRFKLYLWDETVQLSNVLPILENMGMYVVEERPYSIRHISGGCIWMSDFGMKVSNNFDLDRARDIFQEAFFYIWIGKAENDGFNRLITRANLGWRDVTMIRYYAKYLTQIGISFNQSYIETTFSTYPEIMQQMVKLFHVRFSLNFKGTMDVRQSKAQNIIKIIENLLSNVKSLSQDKILRRLLSVILATQRTNFFQKNAQGEYKDYLSFKLIPQSILEMPKPVPLYEIIVHSARLDSSHLRFGKVARGGLRWSDRPEDYRTEVLGLVKAQQVKNSVIVPLGAKGCFFPKKIKLSMDRNEQLAEAIDCYKTFISGMLDVTDNYVEDLIVPPKGVVCYDEDDPYLVVAADKGTATFSDIANTVSQNYNFWLGDAFASGGSNGYDHKNMAITARGAWESVKRHFKERGKDCQTEDFTCVGIGDMSGDVFGNGMLLSKHIRLMAAFNHVHIFIDPNPDAQTSYQERERLFRLQGSTWKDYNAKLISKGGGIFDRSAKKITLTPEICDFLRIEDCNVMEPNELIKCILRSHVELLWNGGIGTYIRSSKEPVDVGDRSNNAVRVIANELSCKIIGEGGNLGLTQLARIEFAQHGGAINTDAIDNSAGVDCSDHEVNIKILLNSVVKKYGMSFSERNQLLSDMSEEVASLVLRNNFYQNSTISNALQSMQHSIAESLARLMRELERQIQLDREMEYLPSDVEMKARMPHGKAITAPEYAVIMAYTKTWVKQKILVSSVPDEVYFNKFLLLEFPIVLSSKYADLMTEHPLKREIIATQISNFITVHMGVEFVQRMYDETGADCADIIRAFMLVSELFGIIDLWVEVESYASTFSNVLTQSLMSMIFKFIRRGCRWMLKNHRSGINIELLLNKYKAQVNMLLKEVRLKIEKGQFEDWHKQYKQLLKQGLKKDSILNILEISAAASLIDMLILYENNNLSQTDMAAGAQLAGYSNRLHLFYILEEELSLGWFRATARLLEGDTYWGTLSSAGLRDDLDHLQCMLVEMIISQSSSSSELVSIAVLYAQYQKWCKIHQRLITRWTGMIEDVRADKFTFESLNIAYRGLEDLINVCKKEEYAGGQIEGCE